MQQAAERLGKFNTGERTQQIHQQAVDQLKLLILALTADKTAGQQGGGAGQGGAGNQGGAGMRSLAELKLLKFNAGRPESPHA